ncbi:uncharacterized protein L203_105054 [Cryptococcus depauperatus CBS 7841]|uniref:Uncharacterized protein n=1 Tax=Cryptococcus depauperatus CBS 7841 TaxID=1295531 RepID=A0A1E3I1L8_9TREE|nr:ribosomal protein S15 [Cryptococcus depauperatus CBS 7841]
MSRSHSLFVSLRSSFPVAGPSSYRGFSSSSSSLVSTRKLVAKRRKAANIALQESRIEKPESIDPVLGKAKYRGREPRSPWQGCRLQRILLDYNQIAYSYPPDYASGERPQFLLPGVSQADTDLLFGALPHASLELQYAATFAVKGEESEQVKQSEMLMRILDLRNAAKAAINKHNKQKVIDEFGDGKDTGSSSVQAALLTAQIHNLLAHIQENPRDISNKRSLRLLVQQRARHLKYWKRKQGEAAYDKLLEDLGLEREAVEGELLIGF